MLAFAWPGIIGSYVSAKRSWLFHIRANLLMVKTYESAQKRRALGLSGHCGSSKDGSFEVLLIDILMTLLDRLDDGSDSSPSYLCQGK